MYFIPRFGSLQSLLEDWKDVVTIKKTCGVEFAMRHIYAVESLLQFSIQTVKFSSCATEEVSNEMQKQLVSALIALLNFQPRG